MVYALCCIGTSLGPSSRTCEGPLRHLSQRLTAAQRLRVRLRLASTTAHTLARDTALNSCRAQLRNDSNYLKTPPHLWRPREDGVGGRVGDEPAGSRGDPHVDVRLHSLHWCHGGRSHVPLLGAIACDIALGLSVYCTLLQWYLATGPRSRASRRRSELSTNSAFVGAARIAILTVGVLAIHPGNP